VLNEIGPRQAGHDSEGWRVAFGAEMVGRVGACRVRESSMPVPEPPPGTAIAAREVNPDESFGWRLPIPDDPRQWPCGEPRRISARLTGDLSYPNSC
jgi:hypothetical protein